MLIPLMPQSTPTRIVNLVMACRPMLPSATQIIMSRRFLDHRSTADICIACNLGFVIPAGARHRAMANYASLRGPVGMNRVFIAIVGETTQKVAFGLKQGRTFVTNGPLLGLEIDGKHPGDDIT